MIRGNALSGLARYDEALHAYDRALDLDPRLGDQVNRLEIDLSDITGE